MDDDDDKWHSGGRRYSVFSKVDISTPGQQAALASPPTHSTLHTSEYKVHHTWSGVRHRFFTWLILCQTLFFWKTSLNGIFLCLCLSMSDLYTIHYASDQECTAPHTPTCPAGSGLGPGYLVYSCTVLMVQQAVDSLVWGEVVRWCSNVNTDTLDYTQSV